MTLKANTGSTLLLSAFSVMLSAGSLAQEADPQRTHQFQMSPELASLREATAQSIAAAGYIDRSDEESRATYVQARMKERVSVAEEAGKAKTPEVLGYYDISDGLPVQAQAHAPTLVPRGILSSQSRSFLLPGETITKQLHTKTVFGDLIVDELKDATTTLEAPNLEVAGHPATFTHVHYRGEKWASVVYVPVGTRLLIVEADRKLEGANKKRFLEMVTNLVTATRE
jgi:hypothetical protein